MAVRRVMLKDLKKINIYRNPIRIRIMDIMRKTGEPMTVNMIANKLGLKHGNAFYHVKKLSEIGLIEIVKTKKINGITAKFYLRKYDHIYYDLENLTETSNSALVDFNQTIFRDITIDFLNQIHPNEMNIEDSDLVHDALHKDFYYFNPEDTELIKAEMIEVLRKYNKKSEKSKEYVGLIGIGKHRQVIHKLIDDIEID